MGASPTATLLPLSVAQTEVWTAQELARGEPLYNIGGYVEISGRIDCAVLTGALLRVLTQADSHHYRFADTDDGPRQFLSTATSAAPAIMDFSASATARADALAWMRTAADAPIDLAHGPLHSIALLKVSDECVFCFVLFHHIVTDFFGLILLMREVADEYTAAVHPGSITRSPLTPWSQVLEEEQDYRASNQCSRDRAYWLERLQGRPEAVTLSGQAPRWPSAAIESATRIPAATFRQLEALGTARSGGVVAVLFAAIAVYLARMTGHQDLLLGMPLSSRVGAKRRASTGFMANVVPLRLQVDLDGSFITLVEQAGTRIREAFRHQRYWSGALRADLALAGNKSNLWGPTLNFLPSGATFDYAGTPGRPNIFTNWRTVEDVGITVHASEAGADAMLLLCANADRYDETSLRRHERAILTILEAIITAAQVPLRRLPLLSAEQFAQLRAWNASQLTLPGTGMFPARFETQAAATPGAAAISFAGEVLSYGDLNAQANRIARLLKASGVGRGVNVGVSMPRSPLLVSALLAVQKAGGTYVPLDPEFPAERLQYMLADSGAAVLLTAGPLRAGFAAPEGVGILDLADLPQQQAGSAENLGAGPGPRDIAYVLYTSGSTGRPKGVSISHGALVNFLVSMRERPGLSATDVLAAVTTISFDIAGLELYLPLLVGARIELVAKAVSSDAQQLAQLLDSSGTTVLQATPATWRLLLEADWRPARPFRALCGGEALSRKLADEILERVSELWNLYGPTETTIWSTLDRVERDGAPISVGRPIGNTQVHILDRSGEPVPIGADGEICIGGAGVAEGYLGRPDLTAERFIADPEAAAGTQRRYRTGDLGRWSNDGKLYHLGRLDHQIKIRGFRIELGEIEKTLSAHPSVQEAIAAVREAREDDPRLVAFVRYREGQDATIGDLKRELRLHLPDYMVPSIIVPLDAMPLTPNGKVDRAALPNPFAAAPVEPTVDELPTTPMEEVIAQVWKSVLNIERVGPLDNFFELGGYSLLSLRVAKMIEKRTGLQMDPRALFFQNLREVAGSLNPQDSPVGSVAR